MNRAQEGHQTHLQHAASDDASMPGAAGDTRIVTGASRNWQSDPILSVEHLTMRFGGLLAIDDLSFVVGKGDITALIGPNGAGKTTVFNCITGFYKPTEGRIPMAHNAEAFELVESRTQTGKRYWEDDGLFLLERMPDIEIAAVAKVARTFQNIRLFGGMTVLENLMIAQHNSLMKASNFSIAGLLGLKSYREGNRAAIERAQYWLEKTQLIDRADDPAADLPYGDQRRLEIARSLCTEPRVLCLDEPAAGLNPKESSELNQLLLDIRSEDGVSVLLIEHDMSVVMSISDHVVVLDYGRKIADGPYPIPEGVCRWLALQKRRRLNKLMALCARVEARCCKLRMCIPTTAAFRHSKV